MDKKGQKIPPEAGQTTLGEDHNKKQRKKNSLFSNIMLGLSILLFAAGVYMLLKQYVIRPKTNYVAPPTPSPTVVVPTLEANDGLNGTPAPTPYVQHIPVGIFFTEWREYCEIQPVGLTEDGAMATVDSNVIAAWYMYGPSPGENGNALINGHKSWNKALGVFSLLTDMKTNEQVVIEMDDGSFQYWYVHEVNVYPLGDIPDSVMDLELDAAEPKLTLISCTGAWDTLAGTSSKRSVVILRLYPVDAGE